MTVYQISVFLENKPGQLAALTRALSEQGVSLRALSIADTRDYGIARLMVDEPHKAIIILREGGWVAKLTPVVAVRMEDKPGALERILDLLAKAGVDLEYVYAFLSHKQGSACLVVRAEDNDAAIRALTAGGIPLVPQEELYKI